MVSAISSAMENSAFLNSSKAIGSRFINVNVEECVTHRDKTLAELKEQIRTIVAEDRAEVVILACAGLCGSDVELTRLAGVPVLDPVTVGVKVTESLSASASRTRSCASSPFRRSPLPAICNLRLPRRGAAARCRRRAGTAR